ncbi:hypothetical protein FXN61_45575, partial [Lentzea sp. PSKA42]|nr:hypothetical protein [Lentzea indica]
EQSHRHLPGVSGQPVGEHRHLHPRRRRGGRGDRPRQPENNHPPARRRRRRGARRRKAPGRGRGRHRLARAEGLHGAAVVRLTTTSRRSLGLHGHGK